MDAKDSGPFQDIRVRDPVLPSELQYSAVAAEMEVIQLHVLVRVDGPGLCFVKECRQDDGLVNLPFGVQVNTVAIPHRDLQPAEGLTGFGDPLSNLVIDFHAARQRASQISKACGEEVHASLLVLLCRGVKGAVVREEKAMDCSLRHARRGLHTLTVEKVPVSSVGDADPRLLIPVGVHQHSREHETEEGGGQYAALLPSAGHCECFGYRPVVSDAHRHPIMKLTLDAVPFALVSAVDIAAPAGRCRHLLLFVHPALMTSLKLSAPRGIISCAAGRSFIVSVGLQGSVQFALATFERAGVRGTSGAEFRAWQPQVISTPCGG
ncbi:unnamed protein product [Schistocephalus solidus]|uniref:PKS_DH domain-containing protein n=1 Tax=Schistocephalus solidus TaxID=70667 RepID=A0A183SZT7_SCHSO|nr:unnamed protein product [Schistocephalus solidus]